METSEVVAWLRLNVPIAQFFAYTSLTVTTAIVAMLSLRFSYRQHYGWKPILLLVSRGLKGGGISDGTDEPSTFAWICFDLWNRHTYPIVVESAEVKFSQDILDRSELGRGKKGQSWILQENGPALTERFVLNNGTHKSFDLTTRLAKNQSINAIDAQVTITVRYFDPRHKKSRSLVIREPYNFKPFETGVDTLKRKARKLIFKS